MRTTLLIPVITLLLSGCTFENNPYLTRSDADSLSEVIQLTSNFAKAGESYFSPDMQWVIFQAVPTGEEQYQMYVAQLRYDRPGGSISGIGLPIRISPENSRNTCGFFSPDGQSIIFASTAGKEDASEPTAGYQRDGSNYRWSYPPGMEIYRADGWRGAVSVAEPGKIIDLAKNRLTENSFYDAECAYAPDGKRIIFTSNRTGDLELFVMNADGSNVVQLTRTPGYDGGPFFSPDGKRIVFRSDRKKADYLQIYTADLRFDAAGNITGITNERELTHDMNLVNWGPYWHADGKHIIFGRSTAEHTYDLCLMRDDGSFKTRITFGPGSEILPSFSPRGDYLMWTMNKAPRTPSQVYVAKFKLPPGS